jgi:Putative Zn-dependent protease, contains TPR repeats
VRTLHSLLFALALAGAPGMASDLPDLGESSRQYLSDRQERDIARSIMRDIYASPLYLADPEIEAYLNNLGGQLAAESTASGRTLTFFAIRETSINAFALPGGYIGVHTGLIQAAESESELAGVLAHEIAHISQEHLSRMIAQHEQGYLPTLAALAVAVLAARSNAQVGSAAIATSQALSLQNQLNFTREHEREADRIGLDILTEADFDPRGMSSFFNRLQRTNRLYDNNAPEYLRTHPLNSQRIADIDGRVERMPYKQVRDSREFHFVRARLTAMDGTADEAVNRLRDQIRNKKTPLEAASRYGLALALARQNKYAEAEKELALAIKSGDSPMLLNLRAELKTRMGDFGQALKIYQSAIAPYPHHLPLVYGYAGALIQAGQAQQAVDFAAAQSGKRPDDARLWRLLAQAHAALGHGLASHCAEAEAFAAQGNLGAAIEQVNQGLKAGDGNFYELSAAEARRREWQETLAAENTKK